MRFALTDEQLALRDAVHDLLERECPPEVVRAAWSNATGRADGRWRLLAEMGVLGVIAPEADGGLGLTAVDLVPLLEATGRAALPEPVVETAAVAVPLLHDAGRSPDVQRVAAGHAVVAAAFGPSSSGPSSSGPSPLVPYADSADLIVLAHGAELHAVEPTAVTLVARRSVDGSRRLFEVEWQPGAATLVGEGTVVADAFDRGALGTAAQLIGIAQHLLDVTVEYAKQREQFGVPIGSFQAVKHHLADAALELEFARPLVYRAAYSVAYGDPERAVHVSMAKARASDAALLAARVGLQVHGAIGYTTEYDLHLWMKRAWALAASWGDAAWHRNRVGLAIL